MILIGDHLPLVATPPPLQGEGRGGDGVSRCQSAPIPLLSSPLKGEVRSNGRSSLSGRVVGRPLGSSAGFTYIAALVMVVIFGIMISQGSLYWSTRMQRERETELIFRGTQVRNALRRWYNFKIVDGKQAPTPPGAVPAKNLSELKMLLGGSDSAAKVRYLRPSNLVDPITGKDWALVKEAGGRVIGVASTSEAAPLKQANFPLDLEPGDFEAKKKYSEWQFIYNRVPKPVGTGGQTGQGITNLPGTPGTTNPGTGPGGPGNPSTGTMGR